MKYYGIVRIKRLICFLLIFLYSICFFIISNADDCSVDKERNTLSITILSDIFYTKEIYYSDGVLFFHKELRADPYPFYCNNTVKYLSEQEKEYIFSQLDQLDILAYKEKNIPDPFAEDEVILFYNGQYVRFSYGDLTDKGFYNFISYIRKLEPKED